MHSLENKIFYVTDIVVYSRPSNNIHKLSIYLRKKREQNSDNIKMASKINYMYFLTKNMKKLEFFSVLHLKVIQKKSSNDLESG